MEQGNRKEGDATKRIDFELQIDSEDIGAKNHWFYYFYVGLESNSGNGNSSKGRMSSLISWSSGEWPLRMLRKFSSESA